MPPWIIKAAIQGTLSRLPDPQRFNRLFQKYVTKSLDLQDDYFLSKWTQCERHVANLCARLGEQCPEFVALELGTGWFPVVPIGMALNGARRFYSIDMQDLLKKECVVATLQQYRKHIASGRITVRTDGAIERIDALLAREADLDGRAILAELGIEPLVRDARDSGLEARSVDLISSNNTLEHIPREVIAGIFKEFARIISMRGIMSHHIDLADHYANFDDAITVYNFLRFSEKRWRIFNNDLQYQNRLRVRDYRDLLVEAGWKLLSEEDISEPLEVLRSVQVDAAFSHYSEADLAVYITWMTAALPG
jgi:hypothetical protein